MRVGERIRFDAELAVEIIARGDFGERTVRFHGPIDLRALWTAFERIGHVPLPPYIKRDDQASDRERYRPSSRAKRVRRRPHRRPAFHGEILDQCRSAGAEIACVTLHVGLGTFQPLHEETVEAAKPTRAIPYFRERRPRKSAQPGESSLTGR